MNSYLKIALSVCIAATALTAGTIVYAYMRGGGVDEWFHDDSSLSTFSSYEDLSAFVENSSSYATGSAYYGVEISMVVPTYYGSEGSISYSTTNVQVAGIDESDTVKTDGEYIYIVVGSQISIVKAYPPEQMENVTVLALSDILGFESANVSASISGLYLFEDKLIVVLSIFHWSYWYWYSEYADYYLDLTSTQRAIVSVFDVSDAHDPVLEFSYGVSGYELTSRMIDSKLYLVAQWGVAMVENATFPPLFYVGNESSEFDIDWIHYDPNASDSNSFINILSVDVRDGTFACCSLIATYASVVYMSHEALYLTIQKWEGEVILAEREDVTTDEMEAIPEMEYTARTTIYKILVEGLSMTPAAAGSVNGWLLNQFSVDEYEGYLRVATTTSWTNRENAVYVLTSDLTPVGALTGLAPSEMIYSARFLGDTLYLVTFRQVDPLFVIDLSDPAEPRVLGELKIPGFSSYLHPVDENHVLGIGYLNNTVKITLFDVSDPSQPIEQSTYVVGDPLSMYTWARTSAADDHKAVLFDLERGLLVIPVDIVYIYGYTGATLLPSGAYVFDISVTDGLALRGTIVHDELGDYLWVTRSLYIGDSLYTVSPCIVKANSLADLSEQQILIYAALTDWYTPTSY